MRKNKYVLFSAVFVLLLAASCTGGSSPRGGKNKLSFAVRETTESILLYPEQADDSPRINFSFSLLTVAGPEELADFFYGLLYKGQEPDEYIAALVAEYQTDYVKLQSLKEEAPQKNAQSQNWKYEEHMEFQIFSGRWCILSREQEYYTGGAHGMAQKKHYVLDLQEPKLLTLEDFFTDPGNPDLYLLVQDALREYAGLEKDAPLSSGSFLEDNPALSADFFLTRNGAAFHWNPYEIGPYSEGSIEVVIPWDKIRNFLTAEGQEMEQAFKGKGRS
ncbi:MAG: RsiV family protein [Treponema sp.]|jgi:hypothetical protein|nr:RsiV family protein [Treponema sp.]